MLDLLLSITNTKDVFEGNDNNWLSYADGATLLTITTFISCQSVSEPPKIDMSAISVCAKSGI